MNIYTPYTDILEDTVKQLRHKLPSCSCPVHGTLVDLEILIAKLSTEIEILLLKDLHV